MRLPNFLIGGAPRSGTTWLYELLDRHPSVHMARPVKPEPKFFLVDELYANGLAYYSEKWFAGVSADLVAGEKSTDYLESPMAARRIAADLPDAKLMFILREPVSRAYSNYLWTKMNGLERESFEQALRLEDERERELPERLRFARPYSYFSRGLYADLLVPYFERFPRRQILVLKFEDLTNAPEKLASNVYRFLEIPDRSGDARAIGVVNPATPDGFDLDGVTRRSLAERYGEPNRRLGELLGAEFELWQ